MGLIVGDEVKVKTTEATFTVKVEDASKGDIIMGKVTHIDNAASTAREVGKVYEFSRGDIVDQP